MLFFFCSLAVVFVLEVPVTSNQSCTIFSKHTMLLDQHIILVHLCIQVKLPTLKFVILIKSTSIHLSWLFSMNRIHRWARLHVLLDGFFSLLLCLSSLNLLSVSGCMADISPCLRNDIFMFLCLLQSDWCLQRLEYH